MTVVIILSKKPTHIDYKGFHRGGPEVKKLRRITDFFEDFFKNLCQITTKKTKFPKIEGEGVNVPRGWETPAVF